MKKLLLLLLLLAASLLFVSCPHPDSPAAPESEPVTEPEPEVIPPVDITTQEKFKAFVQGCWKSVSDDTKYFWVTPHSFFRSEGGREYEQEIYYDFFDFNFEKPIDLFIKNFVRIKNGYNTLVRFFETPTEGEYSFKPYQDGYCYYIGGLEVNLGWWYKVSDDWNYDPDAASGGNSGSGSGSGTGTGGGSGGGQGGSLDAYLGTYTFGSATGSQANGSLTISGSSWSFEGKAGASNTITPCSASMDGSNVKLTYTMSGVPQELEEVFTVTVTGSSATWHCVTSGGYAASQSVIFSSVFGVIGTDMTFDYSE